MREKHAGVREWLSSVNPHSVTSRAALAALPVMRKDDLMALQAKHPPFGGFAGPASLHGGRVFMSPGPVFEPQGPGIDPWQGARALHAAGFRAGDIVWNTFAYHLTPGAFILDEAARSLGCIVFPGGTGNIAQQIEAAAVLRPRAFTGTPDTLKILLDKADESATDLSSIKVALVSGGALFPSLRAEYRSRGISVLQAYATADLGFVAYESMDTAGNPVPGMLVNENLILEIIRPGTNDPVPDGDVGEIVVTTFNPDYPLVRFGTGDMSKIVPEPSPCGRTAMRIAGWMGRADQRTKVKGMFVDPKQIAEIARRHDEMGRLRLVVTRDGEKDVMTLMAETRAGHTPDPGVLAATLAQVTGMSGKVEVVTPGSLPNDGKVIADERGY